MEQTILGAVLMVIIGICQTMKVFGVPSRWIPLVALFLGVALSFLAGGASWAQLFSGVILGLSSAGLFSGFKATVLDK